MSARELVEAAGWIIPQWDAWFVAPADVAPDSAPMPVQLVELARALAEHVERDAVIDDMDDAIHIAAPWDGRISLCGQWNRLNLAPLDGTRPDGVAGCWTCLLAAPFVASAPTTGDGAQAVAPKKPSPAGVEGTDTE